jgi:hypothetical protein
MAALCGALLSLSACGPQSGKTEAVSEADPAPPPPEETVLNQPPPPPADAKIILPIDGQLYHGVKPSGNTEPDSDLSRENLVQYEATVGRPAALVYFSNNWFQSKAFPKHTSEWVRSRGSVPFIRLMMRSHEFEIQPDATYTLQRIVAGEFDADLRAWADGAATFATPLVVEYGTEVNGDWFPWSARFNGGYEEGQGPELFKAAFRHIVQTMRSRGANNITWAYHINVQNFPELPRNFPKFYYPGDDVVDWVGMSVYGSERPSDDRCHSFRSLMDNMIPQLQEATQKPIFVFEMGITSNNERCDAKLWLDGAFQDLLTGRWPNVKGFTWWNERWKNSDAKGNDLGDTIMAVQEAPVLGDTIRGYLTGIDGEAVVDRPIFEQPE